MSLLRHAQMQSAILVVRSKQILLSFHIEVHDNRQSKLMYMYIIVVNFCAGYLCSGVFELVDVPPFCALFVQHAQNEN